MPKNANKPMTDYATISERLKELLPDFPPALQQASTYMLEHPGDIATLSMRRVASNAGVSLPNFSRIAKALGFETYGQLREIYRRQVQRNDIREYHLRAEGLQKTGGNAGARDLWHQFRETALSNLEAVFDTIDPDHFATVAKTLNDSRTIYLSGMQASASFSSYAHYIGGMLSSKFRLIRGDGGIFADPIAEMGEGDAMLAISHRPSSRTAVELAIIARERGAKVVAITDSPASPIAIEADHVLVAPNQSPLFFESYATTTFLLEALLGFVTAGQSSEAIERIERIEQDRLRLNEYWKNKKA